MLSTFILSSANAFGLDQSKILYFGKQLIIIPYQRQFTTQSCFTYQQAFEHIAAKAGNISDQHFLLSPQCFTSFPKQINIQAIFQNAFNVDSLQNFVNSRITTPVPDKF